MPPDPQTTTDSDLLARGGGNATAAGVAFQAGVGTIFAAQILTERQLDRRLRLGDARPRSVRFETEAPIDDILVETDAGGWVFVQAKTALSLSESLDSEFGKTIGQIVRQWQACSRGVGKRGWDRSLVVGRDRMVIATGPGASGTISGDLVVALSALQAPTAAPLPQAQQQALDRVRSLLARAWEQIVGTAPSAQEVDAVLQFVSIIPFDLRGGDGTAAIETLVRVTESAADAAGVFAAIEQQCASLMARRLGTNGTDLRQALASSGARLRATPRYQHDIDQLRSYSARVQTHLTQYEETKVGDVAIKIDRACTGAAVDAAKVESVVLVGEPGAGKSAVVSAAAQRLRDEGYEVIELAVDRLEVESLDGLRIALGLEHGLREVLENWPGSEPAFLFIDALDATRGGRSEAVFRALIGDVLDISNGRWHVVASIRTFDLRLGEQFKNLFAGTPPNELFVDPAFPNVRHIHVPRWSDDELAEVLRRAPAIGTAIDRGGDRLRDLARVPFNTRLLADLISGGLAADAFDEISHQVQLLALYWRHRVERLGAGAELVLRTAVAQMVATQKLQANRLDVANTDPAAFDNLRHSNVLITVANDRYVSFRHHILFDYAASRVFIDPADVAATADLLRRDRGLGLMLAPALAYALQDLWVSGGNDRAQFWRAIVHFAGDGTSDPVARSVAARAACELSATPEDMVGLIAMLAGPNPTCDLAFRAFSHIVGALTVRIEDGSPTQLMPWCYLAREASNHVAELAWPLRTLLYLLLERISQREQIVLAGQAARTLLEFALGQTDRYGQLVAATIGFVGDTFASDPTASRRSLEQLLTPARLHDHAHEDMPWLARKILKIGASDPTFAAEIYGAVFGYGVSSDDPTSIGGSQILPLRSNRRQDYDLAKWTLKEAFPRFLGVHPVEGVTALISALEGHVAEKHPLEESAQEVTVQVGSRTVRMIDDHSHIWAWNPDDAHSDNAVSLVQAFFARLREAPADVAGQIVNQVIDTNRLAILWSRIFKAGAERPDPLGKMLWPFATQTPFLISSDTSKDATDLIAARFPTETLEARSTVERHILGVEFPLSSDPERVCRHFRLRIFGTIGLDHLATPEAQEVVRNAPPAPREAVNPRPFRITTMAGDESDRHWWLRKEGVDLAAPANADLLQQIEDVTTQLSLNGPEPIEGDLAQGASSLRALWQSALAAADAGAATNVVDYAKDVVGRGYAKLAGNTASLRAQPELLNAVCDLLGPLLDDPSPELTEEDESKDESSLIMTRGVRVDAAEALMSLFKVNEIIAERFKQRLSALAGDPHPAVRLAVASRLAMLWESARETMWELAELFGSSEQNRRVLRFFADFLMRVIHVAPERVEPLVFAILPRAGSRDERVGEELVEAIGSIVVILWVTHARERSHAALEQWLSDPASYKPELGHALHSIRDGLIVGYGAEDPKDAAIRRRCQQFAARLIEVTAAGMQLFFDKPLDARTTEDGENASKLAKLLNQTCDQFFFASGAFHEGQSGEPKPLSSDEIKKEFLNDNSATFRRIGDVGTPHAIFHLIEMLGYLIPGNPALVFDLVAHALLTAGRNQGFQFESLGADRFVEVIGLFLADHRDIFTDTTRRDQLVACLEAFVDAGWPAARRLLYRLPELLQ